MQRAIRIMLSCAAALAMVVAGTAGTSRLAFERRGAGEVVWKRSSGDYADMRSRVAAIEHNRPGRW